MKKLLLIFLLMPLWCMAQNVHIPHGTKIDTVLRIRPTEPEPAKARSHIRITNDEVTEYIRMRTDTPDSTITIYGDTMEVVKRLFKELLECQKKSIVDKSTINLLFETLEIYKGVTDTLMRQPKTLEYDKAPSMPHYGIYYNEQIDWNKEDTSKVIMLVCDTSSSRYFLGRSTLIGDLFYDASLNWRYGYKVTSYTSSTYYLNDSKERLGKNIIVWMDKPVSTYTATFDSLGNVYFKEK